MLELLFGNFYLEFWPYVGEIFSQCCSNFDPRQERVPLKLMLSYFEISVLNCIIYVYIYRSIQPGNWDLSSLRSRRTQRSVWNQLKRGIWGRPQLNNYSAPSLAKSRARGGGGPEHRAPSRAEDVRCAMCSSVRVCVCVYVRVSACFCVMWVCSAVIMSMSVPTVGLRRRNCGGLKLELTQELRILCRSRCMPHASRALSHGQWASMLPQQRIRRTDGQSGLPDVNVHLSRLKKFSKFPRFGPRSSLPVSKNWCGFAWNLQFLRQNS